MGIWKKNSLQIKSINLLPMLPRYVGGNEECGGGCRVKRVDSDFIWAKF